VRAVPEEQKIEQPSPMLAHLDDSLEEVLPEDEYAKLTSHDAEIAQTTSLHDLHRCFRCAEWAVQLVARPEHSHLEYLIHELRAVVHEARAAHWAVKFGRYVSHAPELDVELTWVDDAVAVAKAAAEKSDWASVPWEDLLEELIAMEPPPH
jgi:hypothetical protein